MQTKQEIIRQEALIARHKLGEIAKSIDKIIEELDETNN